VELRRYWSGGDWARSEDPRALDVAGDFLDAFVSVE
jgi:hypothetical protein